MANLCLSSLVQILCILTLEVMSVASRQYNCNHNKNKFFVATNRRLKHLSFSKKTSHSVIHCGRDCHMDSNCKSLNYHQQSQLCELNNVTRAQFPDNYLEDQGYFCFDALEDTPLTSVQDRRQTCKDLLQLHVGHKDSGIYTINPAGFNSSLQVYCDMKTDSGGWLVFQRRQDGSEDFYRTWDEYQTGFGHLSADFWLGNDNLRTLTGSPSIKWQLRVDMTDWQNDVAFSKYGEFYVSGDLYYLHVGLYDDNSTAGDSLGYSSGSPFSTWDHDNDEGPVENCAQRYGGAWWMKQCLLSHLNGKYYPTSNNPSTATGINWYEWKGHEYSLKTCTMKIRELN